MFAHSFTLEETAIAGSFPSRRAAPVECVLEKRIAEASSSERERSLHELFGSCTRSIHPRIPLHLLGHIPTFRPLGPTGFETVRLFALDELQFVEPY